MSRHASEIKVGLAVLAAFVVLIVGIMWGKGIKFRAERYPIIVHFQNSGGLENGALVLVNGVPKGKVTRITLAPDHVAVRCLIDKDVRLLTDYRISIETVQLMSGKVVTIIPGTEGHPVNTDIPLRGLPSMGISDVVALIEEFSDDFKMVLANMNSVLLHLDLIVGDSLNRVHLSRSLANLDRSSAETVKLIAENRESLSRTIMSLQKTLEILEGVAGRSEGKLDRSLAQFDTTTALLQALVGDLRGITGSIQAGEGTIGRLVTDPELYNRLVTTTADLDSLIEKIRRRGISTRIVLF